MAVLHTFIDCQMGWFSDMVQDSGRAERTRERDADDYFDGRDGVAGGAFGRWKFAGARVAGEFEPGVADLDGRRARD